MKNIVLKVFMKNSNKAQIKCWKEHFDPTNPISGPL